MITTIDTSTNEEFEVKIFNEIQTSKTHLEHLKMH